MKEVKKKGELECTGPINSSSLTEFPEEVRAIAREAIAGCVDGLKASVSAEDRDTGTAFFSSAVLKFCLWAAEELRIRGARDTGRTGHMLPEQPRRHWLCDMENARSHWANILTLLEDGDAVTMFCSPVINRIELAPLCVAGTGGIAFYFARCTNGIKNAMDFQMMAELGRLSVKSPETEYIIVSADKGFGSVVEYMAARGVSVRCLNPYEAMDPAAKVRAEYTRRLASAGMSAPDDLRIAAGILFEAMSGPASWRKLGTRNRLRSRYGASEGERRYAAMRTVVNSIAENGPYPPPPAQEEEILSEPLVPETTSQVLNASTINEALNRAHVVLFKGAVAKAVVAIKKASRERDKRAALERLLIGTVQEYDIKRAADALMIYL